MGSGAQFGAQPPVTGRRGAARARVALPATIETVNGTTRALLRNLSESGAMLEVAQLPTLGADAVVRCGQLDCFGVIVWARLRWCGVMFDEAIKISDVISIRQTSERSAGAAQRDLRDAARRWAEGAQAR
jgi:hypothetical protein